MLRIEPVAGNLDEGQRVRGCLELRDPLHVAWGDRFGLRTLEEPLEGEDPAHAEVRGAQLADELFSLGDEESVFRAAAFVGQCADELYFGFGHGRFSMVNVVPSRAA